MTSQAIARPSSLIPNFVAVGIGGLLSIPVILWGGWWFLSNPPSPLPERAPMTQAIKLAPNTTIWANEPHGNASKAEKPPIAP